VQGQAERRTLRLNESLRSGNGASPARREPLEWLRAEFASITALDEVIEKILRHSGLWRANAPRAPPGANGLVQHLDFDSIMSKDGEDS
jgi:hypothetical protein